MNTVRNIAIGIVGTLIVALAMRTGFRAEQVAATRTST